MNRAAFAIFCLILFHSFTSVATAQTFARLTAEPWHGTDFLATYDHAIYEGDGHLTGTSADAQMEFWDSFGRV